MTRMSSKRLRKPLMRKFSGGKEFGQMEYSRSTRLVNSKSDPDQFSIVSTPNSSKSNARKMQIQASPCTSENGFSSRSDRTKGRLVFSKPNSTTSPGQKSARTLTRKASLKPLRTSTKSKRGSMKIHSEISQISDPSVERATCSSTLKDSKFADSLQLHEGGSESEGISALKVCPFSYCSLHGHRHASAPPLKRLISIRRRMRQENRPARREKSFAKAKKGIQKNLVEELDKDFSLEINAGPETESNGFSNYREEDVKYSKHLSLSETLVGEKPDSESNDKEHDSVASKQEDGDADSVLNGSELADELARTSPDEYVETTSNIEASFASQSELGNGQEVTNKEEKENLEPDHAFFQFPRRDSEPGSTNNAAQRMQLKDQKYVRMWRLMYKHAVKGVAGEVENQPPLEGVAKTEQVGDAQILVESSQTIQGSSEMDQDMPIRSYQNDAVKLVQEAFDQILLPEIQELSSDDRSVTSGISSDHEISEQGQVDAKERTVGAENTGSLKEEKTSSKAGDKPDQKASKSWSNLKKIIVFKRFVKALEKMKKINRGTLRFLPLQPEPEAEKVKLRRQTSEERKNADEWMLDFALQKVISKLDPAQQRKVAMLVKAFETVLPLPDHKSSSTLNVDQVKACNRVLVQTGEKTGKETDEGNCAEVWVGETSPNAKSGKDYMDQVSDFVKEDPEDEVEFLKIEESKVILPSDQPDSLSTCLDEKVSHRSFGELNDDDSKSTCDEVLHNGSAEEVEKKLDMSMALEPGNAGDELCDTKDIGNADSEQLDTARNQSPVDDAELITEKDAPESKLAQGSPPSEESESDVTQDAQFEKQSYIRLWGFVYKHMMTGMNAKEGTNLQDEAEGEEADDATTMSITDIPEKDEDTMKKDEAADDQKAALRRFEAIKLIEKAIDEILLPENQDNSTGGHLIPDEKRQGIQLEGEPFNSDSANSSNESDGESSKKGEDCRNPEYSNDTTLQEERKMPANKQMPRSWSNLKKMILLKRFIKALESVRKFNPRGPRFLPLEDDPEAEKVNLKHLEMDEKRSAEEWMLDYALQQAVTQLTPARKRKVKLLVEAFETVTPTIRS